MGLFSLAKLFGMTIRESANDGSDFTNPDADYRRLFLGEDGQLHVKDSAGTVTDIGTGVSDIIDIPTAETDDTLVLAPDGAGGVEFRAEGGGGGGGGGILGIVRYLKASDGAVATTTSATQADVDATNVKVTFTAPASGKVVVLCSMVGGLSGVQNAFLGLRESTTNLIGPYLVTGATSTSSYTRAFYLTGVSAGAHTYKLAFSVGGGATFSLYGGPTFGPMEMTVFEAP